MKKSEPIRRRMAELTAQLGSHPDDAALALRCLAELHALVARLTEEMVAAREEERRDAAGDHWHEPAPRP